MEADMADPNAIAAAIAGVEVVFHCATESSWHAAPDALGWINVAGTENVVNAARHVGARRLVQLSCADVSLADRDRVHWKETAPLGRQPLGALARSLLLAEELALQASDQRLSVIALRPAWLWGPGERRNLPELAREAQGGGIALCSTGEHLFSSAHIDNVVDALIAAGDSRAGSGLAVHVADPDFQTAAEFFGGLSRALGWPAPRRGIYRAAYALAWLRRMRNAPGLWPEQVARRGRGSMLDCLQAVTVLDARPQRTVEEGLRALTSWASQLGGTAAIASMARVPPNGDEIARHARIADDLARS
jgi:nucleoside-diphosphate-sugar epimerase